MCLPPAHGLCWAPGPAPLKRGLALCLPKAFFPQDLPLTPSATPPSQASLFVVE